jgi:hypothetical protein
MFSMRKRAVGAATVPPIRTRRYLSATVLLGAAVALVIPTAAYAAKGGGGLTTSPIYKVDNHPESGYSDDGACPTQSPGLPSPGKGSFASIQAAIDCAESWGGGFTIQVAPSTYSENLVLGRYAFNFESVGKPSSLSIVSTGNATDTFIDGGMNGPVVTSGLFDAAIACAVGYCWQVTATLRGFTIQNGNGGRWRAGNVDEIVGDTVSVGGGVFNGPGSNLTLVNDRILDNDVTGVTDELGGPYFGMGGGIFNDSFAKLTLSATTVGGNTADAGGGIANAPLWAECPMHYCFSGDVHIQSSSAVTGNDANEYGGGLMLTTHGSISVSSSTLGDNHVGPSTQQWEFPWPSEIGGAIASVPSIWHDPYAPGGQLSLNGTNVTGNSGPGGGGAIANVGGQLTMSGGTMANNAAADGPGGAILNLYEGSASIGTPNINANTAGTVGGGIANCLQSTLNLSGGKIQSNVATESGGGLGAEAGSPWSAVRTAIRSNVPDQTSTVECGITIPLLWW